MPRTAREISHEDRGRFPVLTNEDKEPSPVFIFEVFLAGCCFVLFATSITISSPKVTTTEKTKAKEKEPSYWAAERINNEVVISEPIDFFQACLRVAKRQSVMCRNQSAAYAIVVINGYWNYAGPEIHDGVGYYYHYHPTRKHTGYESTHIWFYE